MLKIIKYTIVPLLLLLIIFGVSLFSGIKIDSFSFGNFSVSQLYLKLDKKLILEVEEIIFTSKESQVKSSTEDIQKSVENLEKALSIFEKIDIERLKIKGNEFTILLNEKNLYLDNKYVNVSADLDISSSQIFLDVYSVYLKDLKLTLIGKSKVDLSKKVFNFFGTYDYANVEGEINAQLNEKYFDFYVNTTKSIKSLKFLKELFRLDSVAEAWMYDNVKGDISLNYLYGKIDLEKKEAVMDSIKGQAVITDAKIRFHKDVKTVNTKKLTIDYEDDTLSFDLEKPVYNKSKIYGSRVYIPHLTSLEKGMVVVDLKTKSMLNDDILEILKAYEIKLPLRQISGKLDSTLVLKIPYLASKKMSVDGTFKATNALLKLNNFEFLATKADVVLKDNDVIIKNSHMTHKDMLDANLDLTIDTKTLTAKGKAKVNSFVIKDEKELIVDIKDLDTNLGINFNDTAKINLEALKTKLDIKKEYIDVDIEDLSLVYPYSNLLQTTDIKKGDLNVKVFDEQNIDFHVNAKELDFPFEKDGKKIDVLSANGVITKDEILIKTDDKDIEILIKKNKNTLLKLNNIDLVLNTKQEDGNKTKKSFPDVDLELKNSKVIVDKKEEYKASWANININNSKVKFEGEALDVDLPVLKDGKKVTSLVVDGTYKDSVLNIKTKDKKLELKYDINKNRVDMKLDSYDISYNTKQEESPESETAFYINGKNSNIVINDKHIAKANSYMFVFENYKTRIDLKYKDTEFLYHKDSLGNISVEAKKMNDEFLNALLSKNLIEGGNVDLMATGKKDIINGTANFVDTKIVDLAILNNLIILINTSPAIINPFLAVPSVVGMATKDGLSFNGYKVTEGKVDFTYDFKSKFLNMHKITTKGNGIDFDGFTTINFENSHVNSKLKLIFFKDYSKIVGAIPVVNYILLGDEKKVDTEVIISGTLDDPKYKTKLVSEGIKAPVNLIKRIIKSPIELLKSIAGDNKEEKKKE